jgi:hypothetical protein
VQALGEDAAVDRAEEKPLLYIGPLERLEVLRQQGFDAIVFARRS